MLSEYVAYLTEMRSYAVEQDRQQVHQSLLTIRKIIVEKIQEHNAEDLPDISVLAGDIKSIFSDLLQELEIGYQITHMKSTVGEKFNPLTHNGYGLVDCREQERQGLIAKEISSGYLLKTHDKETVFRKPLVLVYKTEQKTEEEQHT